MNQNIKLLIYTKKYYCIILRSRQNWDGKSHQAIQQNLAAGMQKEVAKNWSQSKQVATKEQERTEVRAKK